MMLSLILCSALSAPPIMQAPVPDGPVYLAQADATAPTVAPAAAPTVDDAGGLMATMIQSFKDKNWPLAFGALALLLTLLIGVVNGFLFKFAVVPDETRKAILPWLVAVGGCLTVFGLALIGGLGWWQAIVAGFVTGAAASGLWELVFKRIKDALAKPAAAPKP